MTGARPNIPAGNPFLSARTTYATINIVLTVKRIQIFSTYMNPSSITARKSIETEKKRAAYFRSYLIG